MNTGVSTEQVRVLPFRVRPLPDEPFDSWLEMLAASYRATIGETACALGLLGQKHGEAVSATRSMANMWATQLSDEDAVRLEQSTGIPAAQFHNMTRMCFVRHAIRYTRTGRIPPRSAVAKTGGRYCPDCLIDSGGRWRMSWQFSLGFACARHRRLLVDVCPGCGQAPRRNSHPLTVIPVPGTCHNSVGVHNGPPAKFCRADLTAGVETILASDEVLTAQRLIMRVMSMGEARFGIYAGAPQPALRVFEDFRLLSRLALRAIAGGETAAPDIDLLARLNQDQTGSVGAAIGSATAIAALDDPRGVVRLLRGRVGRSTSYPLCTPQLQTLIAASCGRTRRPTAFLQSAPVVERDPAERARKVPAQIWDEWVLRLAPHHIDRELTATALSAALVFTGSRVTHSAALALIDPTASIRQVTRVMRALDQHRQESEPIHAILRLAAFLDAHDVPIDYARRRALDYRDLLSKEEWRRVCRRLNVVPGRGARWRLARTSLYRNLTGNCVRHIDENLSRADVDKFTDALPASLREELDRVGREFLAARGIFEPLTWAPKLDDFGCSLVPDPADAGLWPAARPAFAAAEEVMSLDEIVVAYASGTTTYELAQRTGVSRQTISRILAQTSTPTRRGRVPALEIDVEQVRRLYEVERLTMQQIAGIMGCSQDTISRRLRDAHARAPHRRE